MISGIGVSEGISIGKIIKYNQVELVITKKTICDVEKEIEIFKQCIEKSIVELNVLKIKTEKNMDVETSEIFDAHIQILNDPELESATTNKIEDEHVNADYAFKVISDSFVEMFEAMENEYFRERALDIKDVAKRVLMNIQGIESVSLCEIEEEVILVAKDLTPSDTAQLDRNLVKGFITNIGGKTSHTAIMARIMEIPAVVGTKNGFETLNDGDYVILDGFTGKVIIDPSKHELSEYKTKISEYEKNKTIWETFKDKKSTTKDNKHYEICANIGNLDDLEGVINSGAEGIGLYRTEFLYMNRSDFPNEEEQLKAYKLVLEAMGDKPVVVRTLDIGGDKKLKYFQFEEELNPFLGNRALRLCMNKPELFKVQLRALLRSSVFGNLHIMFPMVATIDELRSVKKLLKEVEDELISEGVKVNKMYKIGIMVEIPATAMLAHVFAKEVDFFSIGTNDLIQYTFAADRMNEKVSYLYQPCNPSLLRLISIVIEAAHKQGKWVGMCGEMAGDLKYIPLLMGLGLDELSMCTSGVLKARHLISQVYYKDMHKLAKKALEMENQQQVLELLNNKEG
jgi:phosphotransferase system enzyme I (PtsI)